VGVGEYMERGSININKYYELEYCYFDRNTDYKYFNRKFEIYLIEKKTLKKNYVLHMDNCDISPGKWSPHIHKASNIKKKIYFGVSTLNWNDVKNNLADIIANEIGEQDKKNIKKAINKLSSPKL
jgi:hypothetical protein